MNKEDIKSTDQSEEPKKKYYNPSISINFRLRESQAKTLRKHFKLCGYLSLSQGIRSIISKYLDQNNLLDD